MSFDCQIFVDHNLRRGYAWKQESFLVTLQHCTLRAANCVDMKIEGRHPRSRVARSATGGSAAEQVIEVYDALAELYADHYEFGNPDRPFLNEFLSHLRRGARLLDVGCGTGSSFEHESFERSHFRGSSQLP
jgi:hypothetical protein